MKKIGLCLLYWISNVILLVLLSYAMHAYGLLDKAVRGLSYIPGDQAFNISILVLPIGFIIDQLITLGKRSRLQVNNSYAINITRMKYIGFTIYSLVLYCVIFLLKNNA